MTQNTLTVTDNRTGKTYELPIENETVPAAALRKIKVNDDDFGLMTYDPGYGATASCKSDITYIDGDKGILQYRGYPIEELAEKSNFLEVAYLLIYGELPTEEQSKKWVYDIMHHTYIHENMARLIEAYRYDAHPVSMMISAIASLSTFHNDAKDVDNEDVRNRQVLRILGKLPTIAAFTYRHRIGRPYNYPNSDLSYTANFLYMLDFMGQTTYEVNPVLAKALDVLFILHADHE
ncbi:MAG: citrate (Si)-synthase, partial [Caldilineaceae bacterium]|nr:citrate (Si)-synthase [Caldilineaceae bacterium]